MKLAQKGILFASLSLALELGLFGVHAQLLHQAEHQNWRNEHAKALITESNELMKLFYDASVSLLALAAHKGDSFLAIYKRRCEEIPHQVELVRSIAISNPDDSVTFSKIEKSSNKALYILQRSAKLIEEGNRSLAFISGYELHQETLQVSSELMSELQAFVDRERKIAEFGSKQEVQLRRQLENLTYAGVALNVAITIALVMLFTRSITSRLDVMVDNTVLLTKKQPLHPVSAGHDEIARLDQVFHDMADSLRTAEQAQKEFLSIISHELRSPLSAIQATLTLLSSGAYGPQSDYVTGRIRAAELNAIRLIALINEILQIHKMEAGKLTLNFESVLLAPIVERSVDTAKALAESKALTFTAEGRSVEVFADPARLEQVLVNLLANAVRFSPPNGTIAIDTIVTAESVEVRVCDQGPGIPESKLAAIFDRFEQVSEKIEANTTGLGLTICKQIIEGHGGTIGVRSEEPKGSIFFFVLPR